MPLDPQTQAVLEMMAAMSAPPVHAQSVEEARQAMAMMAVMAGEPEPVGKVEDRDIAGPEGTIPVRIYTPEGKGPFPVLVFFHGGGWVVGNIESHDAVCRTLTYTVDCVAVGGDSAGGNLAAVVSLMARDRGGPSLVYQLLIYPATDYYLPGTPSLEENAEGYMLTRDDMIWFLDHYLASEADIKHPYAFPLQAGDLSGLPPAMVITAEYDPLRDEGE